MMKRSLYVWIVFGLLVGMIRAEEQVAQVFEVGVALEDGLGVDFTRANGEILNLRIVEDHFVCLVLDADRVMLEPLMEKIVVRGEELQNKTNKLHLVLTRAGGPSLTHPRRIPPPQVFWLQLVVLDGTDASEVLPRTQFRP